MDLRTEDIDRIAAAMWSVYQNNLHQDPAEEQDIPPHVRWGRAEAKDRVVWRAMALRAYIELRDMHMTAT